MPVNFKLHAGLNDKVSLFNKKAAEHQEKQLENPFSEWGTAACPRRRLSRDDSNYGRPVEGSKTAERGKKAEKQLQIAIRECCEVIFDCGHRLADGTAFITFGRLFHIYNSISDKCVGLLMRARKHGLVDFEGEMLFQRRDDDVVISLRLPLNVIRKQFGFSPLAGGGEVPGAEIKADIAESFPDEAEIATAFPDPQPELDSIREGPNGDEKDTLTDNDDEDWRLLADDCPLLPFISDIVGTLDETTVPIVIAGAEINNRNEASSDLHTLLVASAEEPSFRSDANLAGKLEPVLLPIPPQKCNSKEKVFAALHEQDLPHPITAPPQSIEQPENFSALSLSTPPASDENITSLNGMSECLPFHNAIDLGTSSACHSYADQVSNQSEKLILDFSQIDENRPELQKSPSREAEAPGQHLVIGCPTIDSQVTLPAEASPVISSEVLADSNSWVNEAVEEEEIEKLTQTNEPPSIADVHDFQVATAAEDTAN